MNKDEANKKSLTPILPTIKSIVPKITKTINFKLDETDNNFLSPKLILKLKQIETPSNDSVVVEVFLICFFLICLIYLGY